MNNDTEDSHLNYASLTETQVNELEEFEETFNKKNHSECYILVYKKSDQE